MVGFDKKFMFLSVIHFKIDLISYVSKLHEKFPSYIVYIKKKNENYGGPPYHHKVEFYSL